MRLKEYLCMFPLVLGFIVLAFSARADFELLEFIPAIIAGSRPTPPPCAGQIPSEPPAAGDYRVYERSGVWSSQVAIARNGWRALSRESSGVYLFGRDSNDPLGHIPGRADAISMAHDGSAFAIADQFIFPPYGSLQYFECDATQPTWSYGGLVSRVSVGAEGRWVAASNENYFLLFRRDRHTAGVAKPELKLELSTPNVEIHDMAFTDTGPYAAVITATKLPPHQYTLHLIGRRGTLWSSELPEGSCNEHHAEAVIDISTDGRFVAVGGFGGLLRFYSTQSPIPLWTVPVVSSCQYVFTDLAISANGSSLAFVLRRTEGWDDCIYFVHDTSQAPDLNDPQNWRWAGGPSFAWRQPYPPPEIVIAQCEVKSWDDDCFMARYLPGHVDISEDGEYIFLTGSFVYEYPTDEICIWRMFGMSFHRDSRTPLRLYASGPCRSFENSGAISPDGSWVMMGGHDSVARFEMAPVERIESNMPGQVELPLISGLVELPPVHVDYTIYKAGRAANLRQHWNLGACNFFTCPWGDCDFQWDLTMPTGNIVTRGTREIDLPTCFLGPQMCVDPFILFSTLKDTSTLAPYWIDDTIVAKFTPICLGGLSYNKRP